MSVMEKKVTFVSRTFVFKYLFVLKQVHTIALSFDLEEILRVGFSKKVTQQALKLIHNIYIYIPGYALFLLI